jgi:RNase P subunit RPR2
MPTVKILNACSKCLELLRDGFNIQVSKREERSTCEMCGAKGTVRAVRIDGKKTYDKRDSSYNAD